MRVGTKEFYDIMSSFERDYSCLRLDKEDKSLWKRGRVYKDGETNKLYKAYCQGYALGRCMYMEETKE